MQKNIIRKIQWGLLFLLLFPTTFASAQKMNNTLYLMQNVPQSNLLNPAIQPECKFMLGFPGASSIYINFSNSSFSYQDIIHKGTGIRQDSLVIDINKFHDALQTTNYISEQFEAELFSIGIRAKSMFFTLNVTEKNDMRFAFDKEMITFLKNGNADFMGRTARWGGFGIDANHYREVALGISKRIDRRWTVGVKGKVLFGIVNLNMDESDIDVFTSKTGDQITLRSTHLMNMSLPIGDVNNDADGYVDDIDFSGDNFDMDFALNTQNRGYAMDLGMSFKMDKKATLYASIIDLGYINWKTNTHQFSQDITIDYQGGDISQSGNSKAPGYKEIGDVMEDLADSIADQFKIESTGNSYRTGLPTKIFLGGSYKLGKRLNLGALSRTEIYNGKVQSSMTFSANARLIRNISTTMSYSMINNSYNNLGFGLATKLGPLQMYMISDNIMAVKDPSSARLFNFRFGLNLMFGCRDKTQQKNSCAFQEDRSERRPLYR